MLELITDSTNSILTTPTKKVTDPATESIQNLLTEMLKIMRQKKGIGLAAPQVGINLRICVIEIDNVFRFFINPEITKFSKDKIIFEEGCLSLPGQFLPIERHQKITASFHDEKDKKHKKVFTGIWAIALQHEIDHLDGILIIHRHAKQNIKTPYKL